MAVINSCISIRGCRRRTEGCWETGREIDESPVAKLVKVSQAWVDRTSVSLLLTTAGQEGGRAGWGWVEVLQRSEVRRTEGTLETTGAKCSRISQHHVRICGSNARHERKILLPMFLISLFDPETLWSGRDHRMSSESSCDALTKQTQ